MKIYLRYRRYRNRCSRTPCPSSPFPPKHSDKRNRTKVRRTPTVDYQLNYDCYIRTNSSSSTTSPSIKSRPQTKRIRLVSSCSCRTLNARRNLANVHPATQARVVCAPANTSPRKPPRFSVKNTTPTRLCGTMLWATPRYYSQVYSKVRCTAGRSRLGFPPSASWCCISSTSSHCRRARAASAAQDDSFFDHLPC